ncbi:leucine-rich repeat domain-containing protein [Kribbella solani]|uniref:Disease resistance R13L4/SHOC-2-like LRR domain-containing protein n=1 Tax=Kribbella solani TaxID=236067 RepID=A0A841E638_9ACTN|nr:CHAT domain-containing protein [Kribbella solani]MBB5982758.1 hypothetical protein [Kribbella solani]
MNDAANRLGDLIRVSEAMAAQDWQQSGHLSLRRMGLRSLPDRVPSLELLTSLDLSDNQLTELPPAWLADAPRLQRLVLAGNRLTELPATIGQATALRLLDVSDNRLEAIPAEIAHCHELRRIDVSSNGLRDLTPLAEVPGLLILDAADNRLSELTAAPGPPTLTALDLSGNELATLPAAFARLPALHRLDLSGNHLTSAALDVLAELPLEELYLDDNELDTLAPLPSSLLLSAQGNEASESVLADLAMDVSDYGLSLAIPEMTATQRVLDLYYKRFYDLQATVAFGDGMTLDLSAISRRTAVESVSDHQLFGTSAQVRLSPAVSGDERGDARGNAFLAQSLSRLSLAGFIRPVPRTWTLQRLQRGLAPRVLNVALTDSERQLLSTTAPLRPDAGYQVRIDIGPLVEDSVIINPVPLQLDDPDDEWGYQFDVVVSSSDVTVDPGPYELKLPLTGASRYLYVPFRTGASLGAAALRVTLYHRNNAVQSARVDFDIERRGRRTGHIKGMVDYALTDDVGRSPELPYRNLNILTNDGPSGTHKIVVNNGERAIAVTVSDQQATTVLTAIRKRLTEITLGASGKQSQYDDDNRKPAAGFIMDLRRMALSGAQLWQAVVPDVADRAYLREHLAERARIQITRATYTVFPWALIYDIPRDPEEDGTLCPILTDWDQRQLELRDYPVRCPEEASHGLNVICPYGFWGFRHLIEQPPSVRTGILRTSIKVVEPAQAAAARSLALDAALTATHFTDLAACFAGQFQLVPCDDKAALETALADPRLPLAYFYCHGKTEKQADVITPYLEIGRDTRIAPGSLGAWHEAGSWGTSHWSETAPLVFINGCETAALQPSDVVSFVDAFAGLHAAGVIGTEISVSQRVAGEVALNFYRQFVGSDGATAGTALYRTRIDLLRKGNIAGLVYTPFCSMDLMLERT